MEKDERQHQPCDTARASKDSALCEALLDAIPLPVFYKDRSGKFTGCNAAFLRYTGLSPDKIIGKTSYDFVPRKSADIFHSHEQQVMSERKPLNYESSFLRADNTTRSVVFHLEPLAGDKGRVIGLIGVIVDVTESKNIERELKESHAELGIRVRVRTAELAKANEDLLFEIDQHRRTEEKLKCSEARYRAIIEEHPELIVRMTPQGSITFINEAFRSYYCQARDECVGTDFLSFIPHDAREQVRKALSSLTAAQPTGTSEVLIARPQGEDHWQLWIHRGIFDEQGTCIEIQSVGRDITRRKEVETALEKNERFLEDILSAVSDEVAVVDTQMNIVRANTVSIRNAVDKEAVLGKKCYRALRGRAAPCEGCPVVETLRTGMPASAFLLIPSDHKGKAHWFEVNSFPWRAARSQAMIGAIEYCRDITDKRRLEDQARHVRKQLAATQRQFEELQEADRCLRLKAGRMAVADSLTGLPSGRFLHDFVERESARAAREGWNFALLAVDIDHFRSVNDVYGRAFADHILKQCAHTLKIAMRRYDCISRRGDEFIIVASGIDNSRLLSLAQRIRETIALHNFGDKERVVKLTASVAAVSCPHGAPPDADGLIASARQLVRKAHRSGLTNTVIKPNREAGNCRHGDNAVLAKPLRELGAARRKAREGLVTAITSVAARIARADGYSRSDLDASAETAARVGASLGLTKENQELLRRAVVINDIGKAGVRPALLKKKAPLDADEIKEVRSHPQVGVDMVRTLEPLADMIPLILYHHERWDGGGYPSGARGEDIPLGARIVGLIDTYRALLKARPYRKAYLPEKAVEMIKKSAGSKFDPSVVCAFLNVVQDKDTGNQKTRQRISR